MYVDINNAFIRLDDMCFNIKALLKQEKIWRLFKVI